MSVDDLLQRGIAFTNSGDLEAARAAFGAADEMGSAEASVRLGNVLLSLEDVPGAEAAFRRGEQRGHLEAASSLGSLLWDLGDTTGAQAAYQRAIAAGNEPARLHLGLLLGQLGDAEAAIPILRQAEAANPDAASWAIGRVLENRGDLWGAELAYLRSAEAGNARGAFGLGAVLLKLGDARAAEIALRTAERRGYSAASEAVQMLAEQRSNAEPTHAGASSVQSGARVSQTLLLSDCGEQPGAVAKTLARWMNVSVAEAEISILSPPCQINLEVDFTAVEKLLSELTLVGATVTCEAPADVDSSLLPVIDRDARVQTVVAAVEAVADELRQQIGSELGLLDQHQGSASKAFEDLNTKRVALASLIRTFQEELRNEGVPANSYGSTAPRVPDAPDLWLNDNGWQVHPSVVEELRKELGAAQAARREAGLRTFGARFRQQADDALYRARGKLIWLEGQVKQLESQLADGADDRQREMMDAKASAEVKLAEGQARLHEIAGRLPPALTEWNNPAWDFWVPGLSHPQVLLGALEVIDKPEAEDLRGFGSGVKLPLFVSLRQALELRFKDADRALALSMGRSLILRGLASTPPGKLELNLFDPYGLGQSVAPVLELGEYDRSLIGGKVWSSSEDLNRLLDTLSSHIELIIQKYLRSEFATIDDFNAAAGEISEPYRLLVIVDFPAGFDDRAFGNLRRIVENGPRCGVATLILSNETRDRPPGIRFEDFPPNLRTVRLGLPFVDSGQCEFRLLPTVDDGANSQAIVEQIGAATQTASTGVVTFEKTLEVFNTAAQEGKRRGLPTFGSPIDVDNPDTWWKQTTLAQVAAPIGLRGARDVAVLSFDSADHSGALLVGRPGSGKSTLIHSFIAGITTLYSPDQLELHLIDFREGVEFKMYAAGGLPHARTVAIESDREFGLSVLQTLLAEMESRASLLRGADGGRASLEALYASTGRQLPRIVLLFDEFQVLFSRNDRLGVQAAEALETVIRQGRGFGVHVLLGSQSLAGLDALGSHVPQLLPVRILLPAADTDALRVLGERNPEGATLTSAGEGILNSAGGAVEANERFRGCIIDEEARRHRVSLMRQKAEAAGWQRKPVVFEGNTPALADETSPAQFYDEIRGAGPTAIRLRFGVPMSVTGSADINLLREAGANFLLVGRGPAGGSNSEAGFSIPLSAFTNIVLSALVQDIDVRVLDYLPAEEGLEESLQPLRGRPKLTYGRRRQSSNVISSIDQEVKRRIDEDDVKGPPVLLVLFGMHRARDFDQESLDYDAEENLGETLRAILRDGPEVGIHTAMWFETLTSINRRLPSGAIREVSWRLAGQMSADDSMALLGVDSASSLREQQVLAVNEERGGQIRCTALSTPRVEWATELMRIFYERDC